LREEKGLTQVRLAVAADMNPATLNRIEMGRANPNLKTLERLAGALDITVSRLLEDDSPKVQASLWPEEEPERRNPVHGGEAARRLSKVLQALEEYIVGRAKDHGAEIRDPASPHFASATAGTLYLADIEDEFDAWCSWAARVVPEIMLIREGLGKQIGDTLLDTFSVMDVMFVVDDMRETARRRIQALESVPDELATRRLEVATARGEESRKRLIELEVASG
jgi:transcriptional regulator with XRE-family HTH domain